jgi:adenylate cyclase
VIAAAGNFDADPKAEAISAVTGTLWPLPMLQEVAPAGLVNVSTDAGGTPRYVPLLFVTEDAVHPSLTLLAATLFSGETPVFTPDNVQLGSRRIPLDAGFNMPLRLLGPTGTIRTYSARELLDSPMSEELSGRLVVLGFTASAVGDQFTTPFDESTPGVEIIATAISQILGGPTLRRDASLRAWDAAVAAVLAIFCTLLILVLPLSSGVPAASGLLALWMAVVWGLFAAGLWLSAALPLAAAGPPLLAACILRYSRERRSAALSDRAATELKRFQAPALASQIAEDPDYLTVPIVRDLVIFFVDLTGFTRTSQKLGPERTHGFLKMYHTLVTEAVEAEGGSVLNYMGDGALAIFGLTEGSAASPADGALAAAFRLVETMELHQRDRPTNKRLACRFGLHAGPTVLSRLGADNHQQVTATGDSVNLASRLMEIAKAEQVVIAASRDFHLALKRAPERAPERTLTVPIRGRAGNVEIVLWPPWAKSDDRPSFPAARS